MVQYRDSVVCIIPTRTLFEMPTAIIAARTAQGFFVAADGRTRRDDGGVLTVERDDQQKIFPIGHDQIHFASALTGTARFTSEGNDTDVVFDFVPAIHRATDEMRNAICADALDYCGRVAEKITELLNESVTAARQAGKRVPYPSNPGQFGNDTIATLLLCGYYNHAQCGIIFRFFHRDQQLARPETIRRLVIGDSAILGPPNVGHFLYETDDLRFAEFRFRPLSRNPTFEELAIMAHNFVAACESQAGRDVDPELAPGVGGHVHAAVVTATAGFRWIPGFEPVAAD